MRNLPIAGSQRVMNRSMSMMMAAMVAMLAHAGPARADACWQAGRPCKEALPEPGGSAYIQGVLPNLVRSRRLETLQAASAQQRLDSLANALTSALDRLDLPNCARMEVQPEALMCQTKENAHPIPAATFSDTELRLVKIAGQGYLIHVPSLPSTDAVNILTATESGAVVSDQDLERIVHALPGRRGGELLRTLRTRTAREGAGTGFTHPKKIKDLPAFRL